MRKAILFILLLSVALLAQDVPQADRAEYKYYDIPMPMRGINTSAKTAAIQPDEASVLRDFLFRNGEIWARPGVDSVYPAELGENGFDYMGGYRHGALFLVLQQGLNLYVVAARDDSLNASDLVVDTVSDVKVSGSTSNTYIETIDTLAFWRAKYGAGSGMILYVWDGVSAFDTFTVDYFSDNYTCNLTSALADDYDSAETRFSGRIGGVVFGETFVDTFWMATSRGLWAYESDLSNQVADNGVFCLYTSPSSGGGALTRYGEKAFRKLSYEVVEGSTGDLGDMKSQYPNGCYAYFYGVDDPASYPVFAVEVGGRVVFGGWSIPPSDIEADVSFHVLSPDFGTMFTLEVDSVWMTTDSSTGFYDTDLSDYDFSSGDWFYSLGDSTQIRIADNNWRYFIADGTVDDYSYGNTCQELADTVYDTTITFYRRVAKGTGGGYRTAIFWRDRLVTVSDTTSSQLDFSELFAPASSSGYLVKVNPDDGEEITALAEMNGVLIISKQSSIWKLNGIPRVDAYARLERAWDGTGFISQKAVCSHGGILFGLARDGIYVYDFNSLVKVSDPIEAYVRDSIAWEYSAYIKTGFWDDHFWISYPHRGSTYNDRTLLFNPVYQAWGESTLFFTGYFADYVTNDSVRVYLSQPSSFSEDAHVWLYGTGSAPLATWATGWLDLSSLWYEKTLNRFALTSDYDGSVLVGFVVDGNPAVSTSLSSSSAFHKKFDLRAGLTRGFLHKMSITFSGITKAKIGRAGLEYQVESSDY